MKNLRSSKFDVPNLLSLLGRRADDPAVFAFTRRDPSKIKLSFGTDFVEFKSDGLDVVFGEPSAIMPASEITDPKAKHVIAFHLFSEGHSGFSEYALPLPGGVTFSDERAGVIVKMGEPTTIGGGPGVKSPLGRVSIWIRYLRDGAWIHFQFKREGPVDMVTLQVPKPE